MTIYFADVSNWQQGMSLAGMPAVIAKATESDNYRDPYYAGYKAQAAAMGAPFSAYHYLHHGNIQSQAQFAFNMIGAGTPCMLDVEIVADAPIDPQYADVDQFITAYRALGGLTTLLYLPQWFWSGHWGGPDLRPLAARGLSLISSHYTTYSDTGPGWDPYGGVTPSIWQYTSTATINGVAKVDMNAYKGTQDQLRVLFYGTKPAPVTVKEEDMGAIVLNVDDNQYYVLGGDGVARRLLFPNGVTINDIGFVASGKYRPGGERGPAQPGVLYSNKVIDVEPHIEIPAIPLSVIAVADTSGQGPKGDPGPKGDQGEPGPKGDKGDPGQDGLNAGATVTVTGPINVVS
jgi:GH25 family lysozyme M1 (1,4-beta-N-acetylmuramidase)